MTQCCIAGGSRWERERELYGFDGRNGRCRMGNGKALATAFLSGNGRRVLYANISKEPKLEHNICLVR